MCVFCDRSLGETKVGNGCGYCGNNTHFSGIIVGIELEISVKNCGYEDEWLSRSGSIYYPIDMFSFFLMVCSSISIFSMAKLPIDL
jgi:hypothetical protein